VSSVERDAPSSLDGRARAIRALSLKLGPTELGRRFALSSLRTFEDLRGAVPIFDEPTHRLEVEAPLGFGVVEHDDPMLEEIVGAGRERAAATAAWALAMQERGGGEAAAVPRRIAVLRAASHDPWIDRILADDLETLAAGRGAAIELLRLTNVDDRGATLNRLRTFIPDAIVVTSLALVSWFEQETRCPLERALPSLRWIFAEHDLDAKIRARLPVLSTGWTHRAGRVGLPSARGKRISTLATGSSLIELLPTGSLVVDGRARQASSTVLPEHAHLGGRYELVVSAPTGLLRLRTGEHVRVVGFDPPTAVAPFPRPRVVRRLPPPADLALEGMTLSGAWLTASVRQAFLPEDPALVSSDVAIEPETIDGETGTTHSRTRDPFIDTELGGRVGPGRRSRNPRGFRVHVEVQGQWAKDLPKKLAERIDADLRRRSSAYRYLRERDELYPPAVRIVRPGTHRSRLESQLRELVGPSGRAIVRVVV
jgi:hypothetical protein